MKHPKTIIVQEKPDLVIANHGSIVLLSAETLAGQEWINEHIPDDALTFCGAIVVEPRYIDDIAEGAQADGLAVA